MRQNQFIHNRVKLLLLHVFHSVLYTSVLLSGLPIQLQKENEITHSQNTALSPYPKTCFDPVTSKSHTAYSEHTETVTISRAAEGPATTSKYKQIQGSLLLSAQGLGSAIQSHLCGQRQSGFALPWNPQSLSAVPAVASLTGFGAMKSNLCRLLTFYIKENWKLCFWITSDAH